ncbi:MAG TPA: dethiobiotin synthase [Gammaproteobacteria bacterium]|nr:dethiobiotin synthase [Gammaproteobacteria bacterium]
MRGVFVTGTDTGVGKTLFSAALLLALGAAGVRAAACKPVAAGCRREGGRLVNDDAELLARLAPAQAPLAVVNPVALEAAVAPHIAAAEAGIRLDAGALAAACRRAAAGADFLVVEGAGGWRVPLGPDSTLAAVAAALGLPVVLVVGLRLGCLNHALLSAAAIRADGLALAGWVANPLDPDMPRREENIAALVEHLGTPPLARLPACDGRGETDRARQAAAALPADIAARLGAGGARTA